VNNRNYLVTGLAFVMLLACSSPRRVAREYAENVNLPSILFISTPLMLTEFYPPAEISDSLNYFKPEKLFHMMCDSFAGDLLQVFDTTFTSSLRKMGFTVFNEDSIAGFFASGHHKWQLSLVQANMEEHRVLIEDEVTFTDFSVVWDTVISEFQYNVWFELTPVNADSTVPVHLLFASAHLSDQVKGRFVYDWGARVYRYVYDFKEIEGDDFLHLITEAANTNAGYLFDFFLNRYLYFHFRNPQKLKYYYTYNHEKNKISPARTKRFVFM
jgi:hypothetical protein